MSTKKESRANVKKALASQMAGRGIGGKHYEDLVDDYMSLWDIKVLLIADIKGRGVVYKDVSSVGVEMTKNNPSVKELVGVNRQMLAILKELGLKAEGVPKVDDDAL